MACRLCESVCDKDAIVVPDAPTQLKTYLAIPSISALPEHKGDVRKCAEWTAGEMRRIGSWDGRRTPGADRTGSAWVA